MAGKQFFFLRRNSTNAQETENSTYARSLFLKRRDKIYTICLGEKIVDEVNHQREIAQHLQGTLAQILRNYHPRLRLYYSDAAVE
jgi:hypothetical protein